MKVRRGWLYDLPSLQVKRNLNYPLLLARDSNSISVHIIKNGSPSVEQKYPLKEESSD